MPMLRIVGKGRARCLFVVGWGFAEAIGVSVFWLFGWLALRFWIIGVPGTASVLRLAAKSRWHRGTAPGAFGHHGMACARKGQPVSRFRRREHLQAGRWPWAVSCGPGRR